MVTTEAAPSGPSKPTVDTVAYRNLTTTSVELSGVVRNNGGEALSSHSAGVVYSATAANNNPQMGGTGCKTNWYSTTPSTGSAFWVTGITGLTPGTPYTYKAFATNSAGVGYSTNGTFTASCFDAPTVVPNGTASSVSFTWNDVGATQYVLRVWRTFEGGGGGTTTVTDTITAPDLPGKNSSYQNFTGKSFSSDAVYSGHSASNSAGAIQVRSGKGFIWSTTSGGIVSTVVVEKASGNGLPSVRVQNDAYGTSSNFVGTAVTTNFSGTNVYTFVPDGSYSNVMVGSVGAAGYFSRVRISWTVAGGGGGTTTNYYGGDTGTAANSGVSVSVPMTGEYNWSLVAQGGGTCSQTVTGTVTAAAAGCGERWMVGPATAANNDSIAAAGSMGHYVVGETNTTPFYGAINVDTETDGWTAEFGYGTTTNGAGWQWFTAPKTWYDNPNTWHGSTNHVFGSTGTWYTAFRFSKDGCTYYTPKGTAWAGQHGTNALHADRYFEVKDTWAGWMGNSYVVAGGTWYNGHGTMNPPAFHGQTIQTNSTGKVALAGEVQTYGSTAAQGPLAAKPHMAWEVRLGGSAVAGMGGDVVLPWDRFDNNNNYYGRGGTGWTDQNLDFSNLAEGDYSLAVWFYGSSSNGATMYETNASSKVEYVATVPVRASLSRSVGSLDNFTATYPNAGGSKSFTVSGTNLTGALTVTAPEGWEVSTTSATTGFGSTATLTPNSTTHKLAGETVWVRLAAGASVDSHSGSVTVGRTGMSASVSVTVSGAVSAGTPTVTRVAETPLVASATVTADVSAMGAVATVGFVYGTSESYGTGGTVSGGDASTNQVAAGTTGRRMTATLANLIAGTDYFYKWTANNGSHSATLTNWFTTDCFGSGPVVTTNTSSLSATLSWPRMDGADHYLVSVWTNGGTVTKLDCDFEASDSTDDWGISSGYAQRESVGGDYALRLGSGSYAGDKSTPTMNLSGAGGKATLSFKAWYYGSDSSSILHVSKEVGGVETLIDTISGMASSKGTSYSYNLTGLGDATSIRFYTDASKLRVYVDDVLITQGGVYYATGTVGGVSQTLENVVIAQTAAGVSPVSAAITSLAANTNAGYSWSVTAVGGGTCSAKTEGSGLKVDAAPAPRIEVLEGDPLAAVANPFDFGTCEVYAGTVTKTFTVTNAGNAALTAGQLGTPTAPAGYTVAVGAAYSTAQSSGLAAGGTATFTVTFDPESTMAGTTSPGGTPGGTVTVTWGAELANSTAFGVTATVPAATLTASSPVAVRDTTVGYVKTANEFTISGSHLTGAVTVTLGGTDAADFEFRRSGTSEYTQGSGNSITISPASGTLSSTTDPKGTIQVRFREDATPGSKAATLTIAGGGKSGSITVNLSGTVYPMPEPDPTSATATVACGVQASMTLSTYLAHDASYTYALETAPAGLSVGTPGYTFAAATGNMTLQTATAGTYTSVIRITNTDGKSATFTWTVTVADAPTFTATAVSAQAASADLTATVDSGGAATTVTFEWGTDGTHWTTETVTGGSIAAGASGTASVSLGGLTSAATYHYRWTATNAGGTTTEAGTFTTPGEGLQFPGTMNGWATSGTTRDNEFGGGNYYYRTEGPLAANACPEFKEMKGTTWWGADATRYANGAECVYLDTNTDGGNNTLGSTYAGYYTWRGIDTGSGIRYVIMYTENAPVTVTNASDNSASMGTGDVTVTAQLSGTLSGSENVYVRYTTDGWTNSTITNMAFSSGTTYTTTIPGQGKGTTVEWYVLTSSHAFVKDSASYAADLCTLHGMKSGTTNFCYVASPAPPVPTAAVAGYEQVELSWALNAAGQNVMIVRYDGLDPTVTQPTDGTPYGGEGEAQTVGAGTVVYVNWHGTGVTNTVEQGHNYTYVFYTVNGTGSGCKYSEGSAARLTATTKALAQPTVTSASTAGAVALSGADAEEGEIYVVARTTGSGGFDGNPSGGLPDGGDPLCGGTVVYTGTTASFNDDVTGCTTYNYKAWLKAADENAWSAGSAVRSMTAEEPGAVAVTGTNVYTDGFALSWTPAERANGYLISIWTGGETTTNTSATYDVVDKKTVTPGGTVPDGATAVFTNTCPNNNDQITSGKHMMLTLGGYAGKTITGLKLRMHSNAKVGAGTLSVTSGSSTLLSFGDTGFGDSTHWSTAYSSEYTVLDFTSQLTPTTIAAGQTLVITITGTTNSLFCDKFEVLYETTVAGTEYLSGYGADGGWATNGVAIGGMDPGTDYSYSLWAVGATTNCTGPVTTNLVHTDGTAKPNPPGLSLSVTDAETIAVTVTRANGEAWELWRFATAELAAAATEPPAAESAGVVRLGGGTTPATGSTTVTDTGLTGCTRYWYRAWEVNDPEGTPLWSNAREANEETATVGTPAGLVVASTNAHGATLKWGPVAGASGYDVEVWHYGMGWGSPKTVTYTFVTNNSAKYTVSGTAPAGSSATFSNHKWVNCVDAGHTNTMTLHGWGGVKITGLTMEMSSWEDDGGTECGKGSFTMTSGGSTLVTVPDSTFDSTNWYGAWSWSEVNIPMRVTETVVGETANVTLKLIGTEDSLFWESFTVTYEELEPGGRVYDWENGSGVGGVSVAVAGTNATVTGLTEATEYGWSVAATGGCTGTAAEGPDFETTEMVVAPTVVSPLSAWVNGISGTVTGAEDADTLWLYRFDDNEHASSAVLPSAIGGTRVTNVTGGAGTWNFADTNLLGCKTYWYRAWLEDAIDGETFRSQGSTPVSGTTEMAVPEPKGAGAGTQLIVSWTNVPGATNYTLQVSDTTNTWTSLSSGTERWSETFAKFTTGESTAITSSLDDYTTASGWTGSNVYCSAAGGSAKLGAGSTQGMLTTPSITGLASGKGSVSFDLKSYSDKDSPTVEVSVKYAGGEWGTPDSFEPGTDWGTYSVAITNTSAFQVRIQAQGASKQRFHLDNVKVLESSGSGARGMFYDEVSTSPTTITGLEMGSNYFFRVIARGEECVTIGSNWATTANAPLIDLNPRRWNAGTVQKGQTVTNTFTLRNRGTETMTFTLADIVPSGTRFEITSPTGAGKTANLGAGESRTYTVTFAPTNTGSWEVKLRFESNAANGDDGEPAGVAQATLIGRGNDPESADPEVIGFSITDALGTDGTVWDQSLALEEGAPVMKVTAWHASGIWTNLSASTNRATWTLRGPDGAVATQADGTALSGRPFTGVRAVPHGSGADGAEFSAVIPVLGAGRAARGPYTLEVTVKDATGRHAATATNCVPDDARSVLLDDFTRADVVADGTGKLERGWTAIMSGAARASEAAIHDGALELYGALGTSSGSAGRIAVVRDMDDVGYATTLHEFEGSGSWGFHFRSEAQLHGWDGASMAGAFVLGSTQPGWLTASDGQAGLAVTLTTNGVQLASFTNSLLANADHPRLTGLGDAWTGTTAGKTLAVRVEFIAGKDAVDAEESDDGQAHDAIPAYLQLYVKEVEGTGGDPTKECGDSDFVAQVEVPEAFTRMDLPYGGVLWAHGSGAAGAENSARFDDIHVPRMDGQAVPLRFWCVDDDTKAPTFEDFDVPAAIAAGTAATDGLRVTGTILDASGLWMDVSGTNAPTWETAAIAAPSWELWVNGTNVASGEITGFAATEDENGESTSVAVDFTIPAGAFDSEWRTTNCVVAVEAWDHDIDRPGDSKEGRAEYRFTLCDSTPTAPAWATVEADGAEMAVVRWAWTNGTQYVVVRGDAEFGEDATPPQGTLTAPTAGLKYAGLGTVAYAGTGDNHLTNGWTAREVLVAPGSSNYFAVYGMTGGETGYFFSAPTRTKAYTWTTTNASGETVTHWATAGDAEGGQPAAGSVWSNSWPMTTVPYEPGEGVDAFAYRTSVSYPTNKIAKTPAELALTYGYETRTGTGSGWSTNEPTGWQGDTNKWKIHDGSLLTGKTGYPTPAGNKLYWQDTSSGSFDEAKLTRWLDAPESGDFFVAAVLNYNEPYHDTPATNKWIEIALVDESGNDIASFGKPRWNSYNAAIQYNDGQYGGYTQYTLNSGHGNDYIVVGQLSRTDGKFRMWVYWGATNSTDKIPEVYSKTAAGGGEVSSLVTTTALNSVRADCNFVGTPADVAGIQLRAGSESGKELGHVYFDEVRFAATWEELFLFNEPEVETFDLSRPAGSGKENGTNSVGLTQWLVSDGALAHGDVGLNATFELYHRTGIQSASFDILSGGKEGQTNLLREVTAGTTAAVGNEAASVALEGTRGSVYGEWTTPDGGATGVAIPTNWISLESNYVLEVTLHSTGGREATATSATDNMGGGATDLFFGEYGEGAGNDKYVEIYNGTGRDVDLYNYWIVRPQNALRTNNGVIETNDFSVSYTNLYLNSAREAYARLSSNSYVLHHKQTVVLLNNVNNTNHTPRLNKLKEQLDARRAKYIVMPYNLLDSNGSVPYLLVKAEDFDETAVSNAFQNHTRVTLNWLDACGCADGIGATERYIMSRKATATHLPRSNPMIIDTNEWDYRRWSFPKTGAGAVDDYATVPPYTNFVATAGGYDRAIGLGGTMEFRVYDDDEAPPSLAGGGQGGGLRLKGSTNFVESTAGDRTYVMGGWSFTYWEKEWVATNLTAEQCGKIAEMWPSGLTTNGGISWAPQLGESITNVVKGGSGKQTHVEFDGIEQTGYGALTIKANTNNYVSTAEVWIGFDLDVQDLAEPMVSFGYAGGTSGFSNGCVKVSATGAEGSFTVPNDSWKFTPITGSGSTWAEWSQSLEGVLPEGAGHVWFRVCVWNYKNGSGSCWLDNFRVEGNPRAVRVTDQELADTGVVFEVRVRDESGVDAGAAGTNTSHGATFGAGLGETWYRRAPGTTNLVEGAAGATATNGYTSIQWTLADGAGEKAGGFGKDTAQEWYTKTQDGKGQLKVTVGDLDDDRANDQSVGSKNFGMLVVDDDDASPPQIRMKTMKPRLDGVVGEWLFMEKAWGATDEMDGVEAGTLGVCTTNGTLTKPRASLVAASTNKPGVPDEVSYAVYQTGWQAGSKYWTATLRTTGGGKGTVTGIRFWSKVGSVNSPTGWELWTKTGDEAAVKVEAGSSTNGLLLSGTTGWAKQSDEATEGTPIGVWREYGIELSGSDAIELPADGTPVEIRLMGKGASPKGIGASWFLWDLEMDGELEQSTEEGEEAYTYKTDHEVAGSGTGEGMEMRGSVWDEGSGLAGVPTWELTEGITGSGSVTFENPGLDLTNRTSETTGAFRANLPVATSYTNLLLKEYKGKITATDADNDRNSASDGNGENYDFLTHTGKFGFTVVDQDVTRPTAPTAVKVNGVAVPGTVPERTDPSVAWTNKPEFVVSFAVAVDQNPSTNWTDTAWTNLNVVGDVVKTNIQSGVSGIGEYRVSLTTNTAEGTAYSVAVTNGALANYGFERFSGDIGWILAPTNAIGITNSVAHEGTNSMSIGASSTVAARDRYARQVIVCEMNGATTVTVGGTMWFCQNGSTSKARIYLEAFSDEAMTTALSCSGSLDQSFGSAEGKDIWSQAEVAERTFTAPAGTARVYLRVTLYSSGAANYFDDVRLGVRVGAAPPAGTADRASMRFMANAAAQGLNAKYLYAVDADNDRKDDRLAGAPAAFYTAYDITPPTPVGGVVAVPETDPGSQDIDPTTQLDVTWSAADVGPDDPEDDNHPTGVPSAKDILSPWQTYKFYHGTYEPLEDEDEWKAKGGPDRPGIKTFRAFLEKKYVTGWKADADGDYPAVNYPAGAYTGWLSVTNGQEIQDPEARAKGTTVYSGLHEVGSGTRRTRLYDLEFDQHYMVVAVGVDKAGNEGPATSGSWMTNNTIKFAITQGLMRATSAVSPFFKQTTPGFTGDIPGVTTNDRDVAVLRWNAASSGTNGVRRTYDLISWDADRFNEAKTNQWTKVGDTVQSNWFADAGGLHLTNQMRFYRAAYENRWRKSVTTTNASGDVTTTNQIPLMSEDVYAMGSVKLTEGMNFVSLHGYPWTNTLRGVFGTDTNMWPAGTNRTTSTRIGLFGAVAGGDAKTFAPETVYWLDRDGVWHDSGNDDKDATDELFSDDQFFTRGFSIDLPSLGTRQEFTTNIVKDGVKQDVPGMTWHPILRVPTNGPASMLSGGAATAGRGARAAGTSAFETAIVRGGARNGEEAYNFVSYCLPVNVHPRELRLVQTNSAGAWMGGFAPSTMVGNSGLDCDVLYPYDSLNKEVRRDASGRPLGMYVDSAGKWRYLAGNGVVGGKPILANDALIIMSRSKSRAESEGLAAEWTWSYSPTNFYTLPTRFGGY